MSIAYKMQEYMTRASWIRRMFEEGMALKAKYGPENVFDFSLGNPDIAPPVEFSKLLLEAAGLQNPGLHSYMPNAGYPEVRKAVADYLTAEQGIGGRAEGGLSFTAQDVVMTCGAAGGLNVILKAILNPGDEVIVLAPYFVEYGFYIENHGGNVVIVSSRKDFSPDLAAIGAAISPATKAVIINSPNNPTGQVYDREDLQNLGLILEKRSLEQDRTIYLITDEPYRHLVYDGVKVPSIFAAYKEAIMATSHSKDLSIPGERIGYVAVHPQSTGRDQLISAMILANRILGFVNAPALMQRVIGKLQGKSVEVSIYQKRRDLLCEGLSSIGYKFLQPKGAFYLFPESPIPDDTAFVGELQKQNILTVPGSGFGCPGYFRIAFCVPEDTIRRSMSGFRAAFH